MKGCCPLKVRMPNNREQAFQRAQWQEKKMLHDKKYCEDYTKFKVMQVR